VKKADPSRLIPRTLAAKLELSIALRTNLANFLVFITSLWYCGI